jgi:hypothetical protein
VLAAVAFDVNNEQRLSVARGAGTTCRGADFREGFSQ